MSSSLNVFCCYAREDLAMLEQLKKHIAPFQRQGLVKVWSDADLNAGIEWEKELNWHLEIADVILLLISPDFMDSDYCYSTEMYRALQRHDQGSARVVPILLRPVHWENAPFAKLQILPTNAQPVSRWTDRDDAYLEIVTHLNNVFSDLQSSRPPLAITLHTPPPIVLGQVVTASPLAPVRPNRARSAVLIGALLILALVVGGSFGIWRTVATAQMSGQATATAQRSSRATATAQAKIPGQLWHAQTSGTTWNLANVAWSGKLFVAVGQHGTILTSPDGHTWTTQSSGTEQWLYAVTWSGTQFVAVGQLGTLLTSPDGQVWTAQNSGTANWLSDVIWSGTQFVAVGQHGTILTSPNGRTWTPQYPSFSDYENYWLNDVIWSDGLGLFIIVDKDNIVILTSPDGILWTDDGLQSPGFNDVVWAGTRLITVGALGAINTSRDAQHWTTVLKYDFLQEDLYAVAWSGQRFVAVGQLGTLLTSLDGSIWTTQNSGTSRDLTGVVWSGTQFVAVGNNGAILTSS